MANLVSERTETEDYKAIQLEVDLHCTRFRTH